MFDWSEHDLFNRAIAAVQNGGHAFEWTIQLYGLHHFAVCENSVFCNAWALWNGLPPIVIRYASRTRKRAELLNREL